MSSYLSGLNPQQREAVAHFEGPLLVLAGAGSGKTRVLTVRITHLIEEFGVDPASILALTFTNKAAGEMRERVRTLLGREPAGMWIGTFHAIGARLLRRDATRLGWTPSFQIFDADDSESRIRRILRDELNLDPKKYPPKAIRAAISAAKNELVSAAAYAQTAVDHFERIIAQVYERYQRALHDANAFDFDDLLVWPVELFRTHPQVLQRYRERFRFVLVDEYQDTNRAQYVFLKLIAGRQAPHGVAERMAAGIEPETGGNLFVVGDDDQCLVAGTLVTMADGSQTPIETIAPGDLVRSGYGSGDFRPARVTAVFKRRRVGEGIGITTRQGRRLISTPEHTHFAGYRLGVVPQQHFTYLMQKRGVGFRLGTSQVYTNGQRKPMVGFAQRLLQEHADSLWLTGVHASENEARAEEAIFSLRYGIPTLPFVPRKGGSKNGLVHDRVYIERVFAAVDTEGNALRLLKQLGHSPDHPHHRPRSRNSSRRNVVVTLCGDRRGSGPMHRISMVGNDAEGRAALESIGLTVRAAKANSRSWRYETATRDFGRLTSTVEQLSTVLDINVIQQARLGANSPGAREANSLPFVPAASVMPGMAVFIQDGSYDVVDKVERVRLDGFVFDLDIEHTHNFIANGIVTHNSIYGWRGADIRNILDFEKDFADARLVRLEENYRSTQRILDAANRVIAYNVQRKGKTLRTTKEAGERLSLVETADEVDEAQWIVSEILARIASEPSLSLRDFVVLYRTNAQSRALEEALRREALPYRIVGGTRFYERREVKDVLAYLRLTANPAADEAFLRIVNVPRRGIGDASVTRLAEWASEMRLPLLAAAARAGEIPELRGGALRSLPKLAEQIAGFAALTERDLPLDEILRRLVRDTGLVQMYREEGPEGEDRIENIDELIAGAAELQARFDEGDPELLVEVEETGEAAPRMLDLFLAHVALVADIDQHDARAEAVSLMTIHNAKGLEYPFVFLAGLEDGLFPLGRAYDEPAQLEEERRLFYVGITRAERKLYLVFARRRRRAGEWKDASPSSFLESVPKELLEVRKSPRLRERLTPAQPWRSSSSLAYAPQRRSARLGLDPARPAPGEYQVDYSTSQETAAFIKGSRVRHPQFGSGTVVELAGSGTDVRATIDFDTAGLKKVVLRYANLEPDPGGA
jgi:DNA helicase II / ATP-dependent DNA helicase PcrA